MNQRKFQIRFSFYLSFNFGGHVIFSLYNQIFSAISYIKSKLRKSFSFRKFPLLADMWQERHLLTLDRSRVARVARVAWVKDKSTPWLWTLAAEWKAPEHAPRGSRNRTWDFNGIHTCSAHLPGLLLRLPMSFKHPIVCWILKKAPH